MSCRVHSAFASALVAACALLSQSAPARAPDDVDTAALLARPVTLHCDRVPLVRAIQQLREQSGAVIVFDSRRLPEAGVGPSAGVTLYCRRAPLSRALMHVLQQCRLEYERRGNAIWIVGRARPDDRLSRSSYDVADLRWTPPGAGRDASGYEEIQDLLTATCAPHRWSDVGGPGSISQRDGRLHVHQAARVHAEIEDLLAQLRTVRAGPPGEESRAWYGDTVAAGLRNRSPWPRDEMAQGPFAAELSARTGCDVVVDWPALQEAGIPAGVTVGGLSVDRPVAEVLRDCLPAAELNWLQQDGALWITSREAAECSLTTRFHNVRDLTRREGRGGATIHDCVELIELVTSVIAPQSWDELGGPASISDFDGLLCVCQTEDNHQWIASLLALIRRFRRGQNEPVESFTEPPADADVGADDALATRLYDFHDLATLRGSLRVTPAATRRVLIKTIAPESWDERGGPGGILIYERLLIVSQTPSVHRRIERLLEQLRDRRGL